MSNRNNRHLELNSLLTSYQEMVTNNTNIMQTLFSEISARITNNETAMLDLIRLEHRRMNIQDDRENETIDDSNRNNSASNNQRPVSPSRERRTNFTSTTRNSPINTNQHRTTNSPRYPTYDSRRYQSVNRRPDEINVSQLNSDNIYNRILENLRADNPVQHTTTATPRLPNRNSQYFQESLNRSTTGLNNFLEGFDNLLTESFNDLLQPVIVRPSEQQIQIATRQTAFHNVVRPVNSRCPITLVEFTDSSLVTIIIRCGHVFTPEELNHWFQSNVRCPICRFDIRNHSQADETISNYDATADSIPDTEENDMETDTLGEENEYQNDEDASIDSISNIIQQPTVDQVELDANFTNELYNDLYSSNHSEESESELDDYDNE